MQNQRTSNSFQPSAQTDDDKDWSQSLVPCASQSLMPSFAANQSHASLQMSYDSSLDLLNYGPHHMSTPCYAASQFDSNCQPSYGPAPDSSNFGADDTTTLAPNFVYDQQLNPPNPGLAPRWDAFDMQPLNTAAALPYSAANDQSDFLHTGALGYQGCDEPGFVSAPTGTPNLPAPYDPYCADNQSSFLDPAFGISPVDTSSANDLECMTTCPASSSFGALTE